MSPTDKICKVDMFFHIAPSNRMSDSLCSSIAKITSTWPFKLLSSANFYFCIYWIHFLKINSFEDTA